MKPRGKNRFVILDVIASDSLLATFVASAS